MSAAASRTVEALYAAFAQLDGVAMQACYAAEARFDDEVFALTGAPQIGAMWRMLCESARAQGLSHWKLDVRDIRCEGRSGSAHWEAHYRFAASGRPVHNIVEAEFEFDAGGLILRQRDRFDFWRWSRQALGAPGLLLGWTPLLRNKVRQQAAARLKKFRPAAGP